MAERHKVCMAVYLLLERDGEVLLLRRANSGWNDGKYTLVAGHVDEGESAGAAMVRETLEEVGVRVENVRYFGSQPWPFPNSLMVGFRADYAGGEIVADGVEIEDAGWYRADSLPRIPPRVSIARALIDAFLAERR